MGFREAVAAEDVSFSQVRKCGFRRRTPTPRAPPEGAMTQSGAGAGARYFPDSNPGAVWHTDTQGGVLFSSCSRTFKVPIVFSFQVREELEAQLSRFQELLGRNPTHVDGHQHVHVIPGWWSQAGVGVPRWSGRCSRWGDLLLPDCVPPAGVCQVFAEALQAHGVHFTRLPLERGLGDCTWLEAPARAFACSVERDARAAVGPFSRSGLR